MKIYLKSDGLLSLIAESISKDFISSSNFIISIYIVAAKAPSEVTILKDYN